MSYWDGTCGNYAVVGATMIREDWQTGAISSASPPRLADCLDPFSRMTPEQEAYCGSVNDLFTADELVRDLGASRRRKEDTGMLNGVFISAPPPPPDPPLYPALHSPGKISVLTHPDGCTFLDHGCNSVYYSVPALPSRTKLESRVARLECENQDLRARVSLATQVRDLEEENNWLRLSLAMLTSSTAESYYSSSDLW